MPSYRIHRLKDIQRQQFRWAPHTSGVSTVKPKDYEPPDHELDPPVEAATLYAAWEQLHRSDRPLSLGDILEDEAGGLHICKYIGLEEARWLVPAIAEPVPAAVPALNDA